MKIFAKIKFVFKNKIKKILLFSLLLTVLLSVFGWQYSSKPILFTGKFFGCNRPAEIFYDEDGVPIINYYTIKGERIGEQRNPVTISLTALKYYEDYLAGNNESKEKFISCANWLVENSESINNFKAWVYEFPWPSYNLDPGWISGMAEGLGIEVLAKAYQITGKTGYIETAQEHRKSFFIDVENGGVLDAGENDGWWYLEYAQKGKVKPRVLNGFQFALISLFKYYEITKDEDAKFLFDEGIKELKTHIQEYDTGKWTKYDTMGTPASEKYHEVHIKLMNELYGITEDKIFLEYKQKWENYTYKRNILDKMQEKWRYFLNNKLLTVGIISFNFELSFLILFILFYKGVLK